MNLRSLTIYLFVTSLLFSSIGWAGVGMLNNLFDNANPVTLSSNVTDLHSGVIHHLVDKHQSDHDCHMASHLIGLNSNTFTIVLFNVPQFYIPHNIPFSTLKIAPPSKPPRA